MKVKIIFKTKDASYVKEFERPAFNQLPQYGEIVEFNTANGETVNTIVESAKWASDLNEAEITVIPFER